MLVNSVFTTCSNNIAWLVYRVIYYIQRDAWIAVSGLEKIFFRRKHRLTQFFIGDHEMIMR